MTDFLATAFWDLLYFAGIVLILLFLAKLCFVFHEAFHEAYEKARAKLKDEKERTEYK